MRRALLLLLLAGSAAAAQAPRTIDPGMSQAQVVERLGMPLTARTSGASTFLFYHNGCERRCGMHDVVVLDSGRVVDAIFRSTDRRYSGVSSSPEAVSGAAARAAKAPARSAPKLDDSAASPDAAANVHARSEIRIPTGSKPTPTPRNPATDTGRKPDSLLRYMR